MPEDLKKIPLIEFRNISKKFGELHANRDISLDIRQGEIHAIVGENGAGKTTLMNLLFGRLQPDAGSFTLRGLEVSFRSPREALRAGIGMVHQDILYFPQLSVLENIILGHETGWPSFFPGVLRTGPARKAVKQIQDSLGFHLEPDRQAKELPFALRQQIEIVRMLYQGAQILILDEPTSLLSPNETEKFLELVKSLRAGGRTVIFISHRLVEVFSVADRISVLRRGSLAATLDAGATGIEEIAGLMMGGRPGRQPGPPPEAAAIPAGSFAPASGERFQVRPSVADAPVLEIRNLGVRPHGTEPALRDISISIGRGEIFGIGGIVGNGQRTLVRVLAGNIRPDSGWVRFEGKAISRENVRWLPDNPVEEALLPERPLWENFLLGRQREREFARAGFIRKRSALRFSDAQVLLNNIAAPGPLTPLSVLSGGNRQKVALARVLAGTPRLAILERPCRGLDLSAAGAVYGRMIELSRSGGPPTRNSSGAGSVAPGGIAAFGCGGVCIILISYDFDELISICDRVAIIYRGQIMGITKKETASRDLLGKWAAGVKD